VAATLAPGRAYRRWHATLRLIQGILPVAATTVCAGPEQLGASAPELAEVAPANDRDRACEECANADRAFENSILCGPAGVGLRRSDLFVIGYSHRLSHRSRRPLPMAIAHRQNSQKQKGPICQPKRRDGIMSRTGRRNLGMPGRASSESEFSG
jgi:hypothetical protein